LPDLPGENKIGPVVPAIVEIVTDPSIPSNAPVPLVVVTNQFNPNRKMEREREKERARGKNSCE